jgi:hypothetical protein
MFQMNLYKAIYCGLYRLCFRKTHGGAPSASLLLSVLVFLNWLTALNLLGNAQCVSPALQSGPVVLAVGVLALLFNLLYFNGLKKSKVLLQTAQAQLWHFGDLYAALYVLVSIALFLKTV